MATRRTPERREKSIAVRVPLSSYEREVEKVVGIRLDSTQLPNDFASLLAKQTTVAEAWTSMKNNQTGETQIAGYRESLSNISGRIAKNSFVQSDLSRLGELKSSIEKNLADEQDSEGSLEHIRAMLEGERFHLARRKKGRHHVSSE